MTENLIQDVASYFSRYFTSSAYPLWRVALEMLLIGGVIYSVLRFLEGSRGARLLQGYLILLVGGFLSVKLLADLGGLARIRWLFEPLIWTVLLTTLVVFQPELRRGLMRLGETRFRRARRSDIDKTARPIASACSQLSKNKIGALIAVEKEVGLGGIISAGINLDARLSAELLKTIFWPGSALHDLGVVVQRDRIAAAGCPFPFGDVDGMDRSIGSRHRAAIGLSLDSDAIIVVVSEETGAISIAERGRLFRHIPPDALFGTLRRHIAGARESAPRTDSDSDAGRGPTDRDTDDRDKGKDDDEDGEREAVSPIGAKSEPRETKAPPEAAKASL